MKRRFCFLSLVILLLSSVALFGKGPKEPVLTNAVADLDAGTLSIFGDNFGPSPKVFLGNGNPTFIEIKALRKRGQKSFFARIYEHHLV